MARTWGGWLGSVMAALSASSPSLSGPVCWHLGQHERRCGPPCTYMECLHSQHCKNKRNHCAPADAHEHLSLSLSLSRSSSLCLSNGHTRAQGLAHARAPPPHAGRSRWRSRHCNVWHAGLSSSSWTCLAPMKSFVLFSSFLGRVGLWQIACHEAADIIWCQEAHRGFGILLFPPHHLRPIPNIKDNMLLWFLDCVCNSYASCCDIFLVDRRNESADINWYLHPPWSCKEYKSIDFAQESKVELYCSASRCGTWETVEEVWLDWWCNESVLSLLEEFISMHTCAVLCFFCAGNGNHVLQ